MRTFARLAIATVLGLAPLAATTPAASAAEIVDWCYYHDIEVRVRGVLCVGADYPTLPPIQT